MSEMQSSEEQLNEEPVAGRNDTVSRWIATVLLALVGLGLAWVHWLGLVVGATLVALLQPTLVRSVAAGVAFGVLAVFANAAIIASAGDAALETYLAMGRILWLSIAIPLVAGFVGGSVGGLVGGVRG